MKPSKLDKAIANLEAEIAVLQLAVQKLKQQQTPKVVKPPKPRVVRESAS